MSCQTTCSTKKTTDTFLKINNNKVTHALFFFIQTFSGNNFTIRHFGVSITPWTLHQHCQKLFYSNTALFYL
jgi:hypothetical protein